LSTVKGANLGDDLVEPQPLAPPSGEKLPQVLAEPTGVCILTLDPIEADPTLRKDPTLGDAALKTGVKDDLGGKEARLLCACWDWKLPTDDGIPIGGLPDM